MYTPPYSLESRTAVMQDAIRRIGFATLVTQGEAGPQASHLPTVLDAAAGSFGTLSGHFARPNPQWHGAANALAIFLGPHGYVSPSWNPAKRETGMVVPTWNYLAVHATGTLTIHEDAAWLRDHLEKLTAVHEAGRAEPWSPGDAPAGYIGRMMRGIVGFSLAITRLEGKWKLSQNHPAAAREQIAAALRAEGNAALADLMQT